MKLILLVLASVALAQAATQLGGDNICTKDTCNFSLNVGYEMASPDGTERKIVTINGQFPGPTLEVMEGAEVSICFTLLNTFYILLMCTYVPECKF
jgi:FtsP/CotA-like multicopper oxidase with cupredoxin domain